MEFHGYEIEGKILYQDERFLVAENSRGEREHDVIAGQSHLYLGRGILEELASSEEDHLMSSVISLNVGFAKSMREEGITYQALGWALAKARIREVEEEREYFRQSWLDEMDEY